MPVALAPVGSGGMLHADGEILAARAAEKFGVPFTLSTMSICSIEDVAANTPAPFWFQLYVMRDREFIERLIDRAKAAKCCGAGAHARPADPGAAPPRPEERPFRAAQAHARATLLNLMTKPRWGLGMLGTSGARSAMSWGTRRAWRTCARCRRGRASQLDPRLNWGDVEWIKQRWGGKLILKGILDAEDARLARVESAPTRSSSPTTAAGSSTARPRRSPRCRRSWMPWDRASRCGWTAASAPARTCSRRGTGRERHVYRPRVRLWAGRDGRGGRDEVRWKSSPASWTSRWRSAGAPRSARWIRACCCRPAIPADPAGASARPRAIMRRQVR